MSTYGNEPNDPHDQQPEGQQPGTPPPYGDQPGYGQSPYGQPPQSPYGQQPPQYGQPQYGQSPYGDQPPYGQVPPGHAQHQPFSVGDSFGWAWKQLTSNFGTVLVLGLLLVIPALVVQVPFLLMSPGDAAGFGVNLSPVSLVGGVFAAFVLFFFAAVTSNAAVQAARTGRASISGAFNDLNMSVVAVAGLIYAVIYAVANAFFVVPSMVAMFFMMFMPVLVVAGNLKDGLSALTTSANTVVQNLGNSFVLALVAFAIMFVSLLACCVGVFVGFPLAYFVIAHGWLRINGQPVVQTN